MKKLIVLALCVLGLTAFAQKKERRDKFKEMTPEQRVEVRVKKMTRDLDLNATQQNQVRELFLAQKEDREKFVEEVKACREAHQKVTEEQRENAKNKMEEKKEATKLKMKSILTDAQYAKWDASMQERKEKMEHRKREHEKK